MLWDDPQSLKELMMIMKYDSGLESLVTENIIP